jgi:DNA-binding beta-propeller fold protein YncE
VATDGTGNVYLADTNNQCIRFVDMTTYKITTVAGIPTQQGYSGDYSFPKFARLNSPSHMAFDLTTGYYYFADDGNARIRYVDPSINIINTVAGNGSPLYKGDGGNASGAIFGGIKSLTCDSANRLYIVDDIAHVIRVIDLASGIYLASEACVVHCSSRSVNLHRGVT